MGAMHEGQLVGGRYRLMAPLGRGAMGQVFRAQDERLRREVAIKVVDLTQAADPSVADRFRREAVATAQLNHPNIVTIFDAGLDGHTAWLVMELLRGQDLATMIRRHGAAPEVDAVAIARKVADALVATHAIGVVHRDIKPANIMVDGDAVTLLDFGIALVQLDAEAHLTAAATTLGTAAYMSPEQAQGLRATAPSDVYALGGVLVALLTGQPPYPGDHPIQVAQRHVNEPPVSVRSRRPDLSPALDALVTRMLAKDPLARPTASGVARALAELAAEPGAAPTAVLPAAAVGAPVATAVLPAATAVLPAADGGGSQDPAHHRFRKAALGLGVLIAAILVFMVASALGTQLLRGLQGTPAPSATPVAGQPATSPNPTAAPRTTAPRTTTPTKRPTLPSGEEIALQAALKGMDSAIAALPSDAKSTKALTRAWAEARKDIQKGSDAGDAVDTMRREIAKQREKGDLNRFQAAALELALSAVHAAL